MPGPCSENSRCAQYVDDMVVAAHTASELIENLDCVFKQLQNASLELFIEKCQFGIQSIDFLGKTNSPAPIAPIEERITKFLKYLKLPSSVETLQRYFWFVNFLQAVYSKTCQQISTVILTVPKRRSFQINPAT